VPRQQREAEAAQPSRLPPVAVLERHPVGQLSRMASATMGHWKEAENRSCRRMWAPPAVAHP
jgi:hypothetical protein